MGLLQRHVTTVAYEAGGTVLNYRIITFGSTDDLVVQATSNTQFPIGISHLPNATDDPWPINQANRPPIQMLEGDTVDIVVGGHTPCEFGGTVGRGQPVTSDASGRAILATAGSTVLGYAAMDAVENDIATVLIDRTLAGLAAV